MSSDNIRIESISLAGIRCDLITEDQVNQVIAESVAQNSQALILNVNIHMVISALKFKWLKNLLDSAAVVFCDGRGIQLGAKLLKLPIPPQVTYNTWLWNLATFCSTQKLSIYLLGGKPGVAPKAARALVKHAPELKIVGTHSGYFKKDGPENEQVIAQINQVKPHILIVCFGMPAQEKWILANKDKLAVNAFLDGGGALDFISGEKSIPPAWVNKMHVEWLYRLLGDPKRLWHRTIIEMPQFFWYLFRSK